MILRLLEIEDKSVAVVQADAADSPRCVNDVEPRSEREQRLELLDRCLDADLRVEDPGATEQIEDSLGRGERLGRECADPLAKPRLLGRLGEEVEDELPEIDDQAGVSKPGQREIEKRSEPAPLILVREPVNDIQDAPLMFRFVGLRRP